MKTLLCSSIVTVIALTLMVAPATAAPTVQPISTTRRAHASGAGGSFLPVVSSDGRFVAFLSHANNLVINDSQAPWLDVFVRELATDRTDLVSVNLTGTGGGDANACDVVLSANGQFVAFASAAGNLVPDDTNGASDVFLRDLVTGITKLISADGAGRSPVNPFPMTNSPLSSLPLLSADGRWVLFESWATNLVALPDTNNQPDLFLRDRVADVTHLVSVNTNGTAAGNGTSGMASFSPDGRYVAFVSTATDLASGGVSGNGDVYVRDLTLGQTALASTNVQSHFNSWERYHCTLPVLSADGRYVAFKAKALSHAERVRTLCHDRQTGLNVQVTTTSQATTWPQISADGRFVACEEGTNVLLWERDSGSNHVLNVSADGSEPASGTAHSPVMAADGSAVAFLSNATNLVAGVTNGTWQVYWRDWSNGVTRVASRSQYNQPGSVNLDLVAPALSADGRRVVFESTDDSLVVNDLNLASDIFVRDMLADTTRLISARHPALPPATGVALSAVEPLAVSSNGAVIAFTSLDGTLAPDDTNGWQDAFAQYVATGTTVPLSRDTNGGFSVGRLFARSVALSADGQVGAFLWEYSSLGSAFSIARPGNVYWRNLGTGYLLPVNVNAAGAVVGGCYSPTLTPDGRCVVFSRSGLVAEIVPGGSGGSSTTYNVYLRDMLAGTNALVSMTLAGTGLSTYNLQGPTNFVLSPNGRWVLFDTPQANLTTNNVAGANSLFARDLWNAATLLVSVGPDGQSDWGYATGAVFSGDSRHVAFVSTNGSLTVRHLETQTSQVLGTNASAPSLSREGRWVAYQSPADGTGPTNIWITDLANGDSRLVSRSLSGGSGNGDSLQPLISGDGRWVVFASCASNLAPGDTNGASDIFARDLWLNTTLLISQNRLGTGAGNGLSDRPVLAANGRTVVFQSFANDLVAGDYNDRRDVFVLTLPGQDTDGDGLDDDWELAYFGTLNRNGAGDFDGDGWTDEREFRAGTDPTDRGSILRVLTLTAPGSGSTTVLWSAVIGRTYRVQFKDGLEAGPWIDLADPVTAITTTGSAVDGPTLTAALRFYRVQLEP